MRVLLLTPPMTQINTPYPATAYLTGFLKGRGVDAVQSDPAIELLLDLISPEGLTDILKELERRFPPKAKAVPKSVKHFQYHAGHYLRTVAGVVRFLQGKDPSLAHRLCSEGFIPKGHRFNELPQFDDQSADGLGWAFGSLGLQDRAKHIASLYVDDLADVIRDGIDSRFELSRYGEKLAASAPSFDPILEALLALPTLVDRYLDRITNSQLEKHSPDVVGITIPFPGNVYGAFRMGMVIKKFSPKTKIIFGGGYVNTELRELKDPRVFDFVDFITLDDGEKPFLCILETLSGKAGLLRTMVREGGKIILKTDFQIHDIPFKDSGTPTYVGLPLDRYLSLCELLNPMHRLWSDGRWNKLTIAHGCYWKKCSFCDTTLDYIGRYEVETADRIIDRIEALVKETGQTGFHFVDEAAPPKTLAAMARRLIERNVTITWWANIRFEKRSMRNSHASWRIRAVWRSAEGSKSLPIVYSNSWKKG